MNYNAIFLTIALISLISCEPARQKNATALKGDQAITGNTRSQLPEHFTEYEVEALNTVCSSLSSMQYDYVNTHEFAYKKTNCSSQTENYNLQLRTTQGDNYPRYSSDTTLFYFKDFKLEQKTPITDYCKIIANNLRSDIERVRDIQGLRYILEVVVNRKDSSGKIVDNIKNSSGCFASNMLFSSSTNDLICLRLWAGQLSLNGEVRDIYFESSTVFKNSGSKFTGYFVYKKYADFLHCKDANKQLAYEAIRVK